MRFRRPKKSGLFTVSARHDLTIRRAWPLPLRLLIAVAVLAVVATAAWWAGRSFSEPAPLAQAHAALSMPLSPQAQQDALNEELADLRKHAATLESELSMREGAQTALRQHTDALEEENTQLKEELAYLQKLVADATSEAGVRIQDLRLDPQSGGQWHYRILLVQGGNPRDDFEGEVRLLASSGFAPTGGPALQALQPVPGRDAADPSLPQPVKFKYYQRLDGVFRVPDTEKIDQFTVQVFKKGERVPAIARSLSVK